MSRFLLFLCTVLGLCTSLQATYYSQINQDRFVNETFFKNMKNGVFVDIGAYDGITISNTYFFEKELSWTGICVEPIPYIFQKLKQNRHCICVEGAVSQTHKTAEFCIAGNVEYYSGLIAALDPRSKERIKAETRAKGGVPKIIKVQCYTFNELMEQNGISHVNFLSIDTEGNEFDILSSIDFQKYNIDVITVEDNFGDKRFIPFLESKGFKFVKRLDWDILFVNSNFNP